VTTNLPTYLNPPIWATYLLRLSTPKRALQLACESLLLKYLTSRHFVPSATHASCRLFSPFHLLPVILFLQQRMQVGAWFPPFPSCACSAFRPVRASIRFLRINSPRGCIRNTAQSLSAYRSFVLHGISDSAFLNCISSFVPYSLPYLLKTRCNVSSLWGVAQVQDDSWTHSTCTVVF